MLKCKEFIELTTVYWDSVLRPPEKGEFEAHLGECSNCRTYFDQMRALVKALGALKEEPGGPQTKEALLRSFREMARGGSVPLGIGGAFIPLGSHVAYFWESEKDFRAGVNFVDAGLRSTDFCVVFGHEEANERVLDTLRESDFDPKELAQGGRLCTIGGSPSGDAMLASIGARFQQAQRDGAERLRLLGNIGWGRKNWPGDNEILEFEAKVTGAARQFPCVVVCMYDVRNLPGRVLMKGGFETHPHTLRGATLRENPYYLPTEAFLASLQAESHSLRVRSLA